MYKVILITGDGLRHQYAAKILSSELDLCGVIFESKMPNTTKQDFKQDASNKIIQKHFKQREIAEKRHLDVKNSLSNKINSMKIDSGKSNSIEVFEWIKEQEPDVLLLYGSSIIKPPLLDFYEDRIINMHLGLSPYYRGAGTNFWPLVDGLPECVGATIHIATSEVDAGSILAQVRPVHIQPDDQSHDLGTKTIIAGLKKMREIVPRFIKGEIELFKQDLSIGKVYKRKDFTADDVLTLWDNFENGMIERYLKQKRERDLRYPIIEQ